MHQSQRIVAVKDSEDSDPWSRKKKVVCGLGDTDKELSVFLGQFQFGKMRPFQK